MKPTLARDLAKPSIASKSFAKMPTADKLLCEDTDRRHDNSNGRKCGFQKTVGLPEAGFFVDVVTRSLSFGMS